MFQKFVAGDESMASFDSEDSGDDDLMISITGDTTLNYTICQAKKRLSRNRRSSVAASSIHTLLVSTGGCRRKTVFEVEKLIRDYYNQEQSMRLENSVEEITIPLNFDEMSLEQVVEAFIQIKMELNDMYDNQPKLITHNLKADLEHLVSLLSEHCNRTKSVLISQKVSETSNHEAFGSQDNYEIRSLIDSIENRKGNITKLQSVVRERMEELRVLRSVKDAQEHESTQ